MDDSRLAKQVYLQRRQQAGRRFGDWCSQIEKTLISLDLGHLWDSQLVGSEKDWKTLIRLSIQSREEKEWREEMLLKPKLRTYRTLKLVLEKEEYLESVKDNEERRMMTAMRGGTNSLRIETGRWEGEDLKDRICIICAKGEIEDERHVILCCSAYRREREILFRTIADRTGFDCHVMSDNPEWLMTLLLGESCSQKVQRQFIQVEVAKFLTAVLRSRSSIFKKIEIA